jgi:prepilin-type N-terminal cleavage/methylation domain-containing protein
MFNLLKQKLQRLSLLKGSFKLAFTLAEVLIVLGIIGIVSALTIPTLLNDYKIKRNVVKLKETYSIMGRAIKLAGEDIGYPEEWGLTGRNAKSTDIITSKLLPYLKVSVDCGRSNPKKDLCFGTTYYQLNQPTKGYDIYSSKVRHFLSLANGSSVAIESAAVSSGIYMYVLVDTNGKNPPNTWGKDLFEFSYVLKYGLVPSGHPQISSNSYKTNCVNKSSTGWGCAYYVINFGNMKYLNK